MNTVVSAKTGKVTTPEDMRKELTCTPAQMKLLLLSMGLLEAVEALVNASPEARIMWESATIILRDSQFINQLAPALGLTSEQVDEMFLIAREIV